MRSNPQTMLVQSGKSCALRRIMSPRVTWRKPMTNLFRRDGKGAPAADLAGGIDGLQSRQHALGEQCHVAFSHIVRHTAVAERTDQATAVGKALVLGELVEDLIGRAPDLQLGEKINKVIEAVLPDVLSE